MLKFQSTPPVKAATKCSSLCSAFKSFQSTPPVKAATVSAADAARKVAISIHAAREGGDQDTMRVRRITCHFNPRRP